jgi:glycine cleavage system transcriptional repressor
MNNYYLLWVVGPDRPGIVSHVSKILYENGGNLEDSSMMRLGSEFGILLIFTAPKTISSGLFSKLESKFSLTFSLKKISPRLASFKPLKKSSAIVTVHGFDRPGLVYKVTDCLSKNKFNITDLSTHRTNGAGKPGYMLFIEGELKSDRDLSKLKKQLSSLASQLDVQISIQPVNAAAL